MAVIPPIIVDKFTCSGNGLLYEGHARESPANLRSMIIGGIPIGDKAQYVPPISFQQKQSLTAHFGTNTRPKSWWLAQTQLYGLPGNKSSTIGQLRERLQTALQQPKGMVVPEKILNMEVDANKEFNQLNTRIALKTQPSTSKGKAKAPAPSKAKVLPAYPIAKTTAISRTKKGGASAPAPVPSRSTKASQPRPPVKRGRVKREREEEREVEYEAWERTYLESGPPRKRARQEQPTGPVQWLAGSYETASTLSGVRMRYRSRLYEDLSD